LRNDSVGGILTRIFALVKAARAVAYIFQREKWLPKILGYIATEAQELQKNTLGRGVSGKLKSLLESLRENNSLIAGLRIPSSMPLLSLM